MYDRGGIVDETCVGYKSTGWDKGEVCLQTQKTCSTCDAGGSCFIPDFYYTYELAGYGVVPGAGAGAFGGTWSKHTEALMRLEIYQYGPIACNLQYFDELRKFRRHEARAFGDRLDLYFESLHNASSAGVDGFTDS